MGSNIVPQPNFRTLFERSPEPYLVLSPDFFVVAVSDAYLAATMTRREGVVGRHLFDVFPDNPDDPNATGVANLRASLKRVVATHRPDAMAVQKYDIRRPGSEEFEERYWSPTNTPILDSDGRIEYIVHRGEDVTEFVRLKMLGTEQNRVTAELKTQVEFMEAEVLRRSHEIQQTNEKLRELQSDLERRVEARTAELDQANEQLRQAQKLEAVGRLAGGVAHDFNNLLSVILSYSEFLLLDVKPESPGWLELSEIKAAGERAADLTRQLLAFSRQQVLEPRVLDLNHVLGSLQNLLRRLLGEDVEIRSILEPTLSSIRADRGQVEQVVMNLVVNSRDAMPRGGLISIETANVRVTGDEKSLAELSPGDYVVLRVKDTGTGMDPVTMGRIFEPFFTTKELGKGTGLGLATVFGIVKQSGGGIAVESEVGRGTTFSVYFPKHEGKVERGHTGAPPARSGEGTILLVDDEDIVRNVAAGILRRAGYDIVAASSPDEAIRIAIEREDIDLLLTDVVMPGMNGRQLATEIVARRPGMPVLFMSGYTDDEVLRNGVEGTGATFVQKPLTPERLTKKVGEILAHSRTDSGSLLR